jgi:hypothetical protein
MPRYRAFDPAEPLVDGRRERFAHLRLIGVTAPEAAEKADIRKRNGEKIADGNAWKIDREPQVAARVAYLAGHETAVTRETRGYVRNRLMSLISLDVLRDFAIIGDVLAPGAIDQDGKPVTVKRVIGLDLEALKRSGCSALVAGFEIDGETGAIKFSTPALSDILAAVNQLRDMYGLKAARRTELTGKDGAPIQTAEIVRYDISDKPLSLDEWTQQYVPALLPENTKDSPSGTDCSTCEAELAPKQLGAEHDRAAARTDKNPDE